MIKTLYGIICLSVMGLSASDVADAKNLKSALVTQKTEKATLKNRKVSFVGVDDSKTSRMPFSFKNDISMEYEDDRFIQVQRQTHIQRYTQDFKDDIAECCYCGQLARFSLLGCCIFFMGYSYGVDSMKSSCDSHSF